MGMGLPPDPEKEAAGYYGKAGPFPNFEETGDSLGTGNTGAPSNLGSFVTKDQKRRK
jgi:hypothetical protein